VDADACCIANMANAAFLSHYPLPRLTQNPAPQLADLVSAGAMRPDGSVVGSRLYYFM
jgi:hypothetical protein